MNDSVTGIGVVAIGRDEGERLERCLRSVRAPGRTLVYVDSGSSDGSVALAERLGAHVVHLDDAIPFTMARARNAGAQVLRERNPAARVVMFIDGDCEMEADFIHEALAYLDTHPSAAAATGFRRERHPGASLWNRLVDLEWRGPTGVVEACGGDALVRMAAFEQVGGFQDEMIAGEEPELCARLRLAGWEIVRLDMPMTSHDADMHRVGQWWRRNQRAGHAFAEGAALQGHTRLRHNVSEVRSIAFWAFGLPLGGLGGGALALALGLGALASALFAMLPLLLGLQIARVAKEVRGLGDRRGDGWLYAVSCVVGKFAQAHGMLRYWWNRDRARTIIEYKLPMGRR